MLHAQISHLVSCISRKYTETLSTFQIHGQATGSIPNIQEKNSASSF